MTEVYTRAYNGDISQLTGDAKIFKEQVESIQAGAFTNLENAIDLNNSNKVKFAESMKDYPECEETADIAEHFAQKRHDTKFNN